MKSHCSCIIAQRLLAFFTAELVQTVKSLTCSIQLQTTGLKQIKIGKKAEVSQQTVWSCRSGKETAAMTELGSVGGATNTLCSTNNDHGCIYEVVKMTDYRMLHFLFIIS